MSGETFSTPESRAALERMERQERAEYARKQVAKEAKAVAEALAAEAEVQANGHEPDRTETTKPQPRLPFKPYRDFATASTKRWLSRDLFGEEEFSVAFGEPGSGKSVLTQDLHMHVAANAGDTRWPWFGRMTRGGLALFLALERPQLIERRGLAFQKHTGLTDIPFALVRGPLDFVDRRTASVVLDIIKRTEDFFGQGLALLGIDTVSAALCGGDENSPKDMPAPVATVRRIQEKVGTAHINAVHHMPHDAVRLRGHGALLGAVDTTVEINGTNMACRTVTVHKANDGPTGGRFGFRLDSVVIGEDDDGITTAPLVVPVEGAQSSAKKAATSASCGNRTRSTPRDGDRQRCGAAGQQLHPRRHQGGDHRAMAGDGLSARGQHRHHRGQEEGLPAGPRKSRRQETDRYLGRMGVASMNVPLGKGYEAGTYGTP